MKIRLQGLVIIFHLAVCISPAAFSEQGKEAEADPRFLQAKESYEKAIEYIRRGDEAVPRKLGIARKSYEHAEDYLLDAAFWYKELGLKHGVDTTGEVAECNRLYRRVHVKIGKVKKKMRRK